MTSLRHRLLIILLGLFGIAWLLFVSLTYISTRHEIEELFDAELAQSARVLLSLTLHELAEEDNDKFDPVIVGRKFGHSYEEKIAFQIWIRDKLMLRSQNAPTSAMADYNGYRDNIIDGSSWRVFALYNPKYHIKIIVGESYEVRNELIYEILLGTLWPLLLILPLLVPLIWTGVGRGLLPLNKIARDITERTPQQLTPLVIENTNVPDEIKPLTQSLNDLLIRLNRAFERERRFTADAAHELRTPLAGLKAQAEVALRATKDEDRGKACRQIVLGVDWATHLLEQLLTLARLDPELAMAGYQRIKLAELINNVMAELAPQALEKRIEVRLSAESHEEIRGHMDTITILLRNLIDNAIRYTPEAGEIFVTVARDDKHIVLSVIDNGPGIPPEKREQVFGRFH